VAASPGDLLIGALAARPLRGGPVTSDVLVLLLGEKEARVPLPWGALEVGAGSPAGAGWVLIGSVYSVDGQAGSLDEYLKCFLKRIWRCAVLSPGRTAAATGGVGRRLLAQRPGARLASPISVSAETSHNERFGAPPADLVERITTVQIGGYPRATRRSAASVRNGNLGDVADSPRPPPA
jgi:hypothetical protein